MNPFSSIMDTSFQMDSYSRYYPQCVLCRRYLSPETDSNEIFEVLCMCRECKMMVHQIRQHRERRMMVHQRRHPRGRSSRYGSSLPIEGRSLQWWLHLIFNLARQSCIAMDSTAAVLELLGGLYSPALVGHSSRGRMIQPDYESHAYNDTNIDPIHVGLDPWNLVQEEAYIDDQIQVGTSQFGYSEREAGGRAWSPWMSQARFEESEAMPPHVGNPGDYLNVRGFEEMAEQLGDAESLRRGAPPAAESAIATLTQVVISNDHEEDGSVVCAICKDSLQVNTEAKQLPCLHLYHAYCILPWLQTRNSCPVCRYELPTDDQEYEESRRRNADMASGSEDVANVSGQGMGEQGNDDSINHDGWGGARRSLFRAAVPTVGIVGITLLLWRGRKRRWWSVI